MLDSVLRATVFDIGHPSTHGGRRSRTYSSLSNEVVSVPEFRQLLDIGGSGEPNAVSARRARLICSKGNISELTEFLRVALADYIDPTEDTIGHAFPKVSGDGGSEFYNALPRDVRVTSTVTPLEVFARALVKGAAIAGSQRIVSMLNGWVSGEPIRFRTCAILNGVTIKRSLRPASGVEIIALPWSTDELPSFLPTPVAREPEDFLGRTVIAIDSQASPPLFRPQYRAWDSPVSATQRSEIGVDLVCQALALTRDGPVDVAFYWNDYPDTYELFPPSSSSLDGGARHGLEPQTRVGRHLSTDHKTGVVNLSVSDHLVSDPSQAEIAKILNALARPDFSPVRSAASRWAKSKDSYDGLVDQFVDLRMALETLYLHDFADENSQEMRFRLALFGAWYLGIDFEDRKRIRKTLRDAYDRASGAVHTGYVEHNLENLGLLQVAQNLCRQGIFKMINQGFPEDWGDLVLGG